MQRKWILSVLAIVMVLALIGCTRNVVPTPSPSRAPTAPITTPPAATTPMVSPSPMASPMPESPAPSPGTGATDNKQTEAKKVAEEVDKMSEVQQSHVVILGDTALVGLEFDKQYLGELTTRIKEMVADKAKAADPAVTKVVVTADPDLFTRISEMASSTNVTDFSSEFAEIINRIAPAT